MAIGDTVAIETKMDPNGSPAWPIMTSDLLNSALTGSADLSGRPREGRVQEVKLVPAASRATKRATIVLLISRKETQ